MFIEHFDMILCAGQNLSIHHVPHSSCALCLAGGMMGNGWKCLDSVAITCLKLHSCALVLILKLIFWGDVLSDFFFFIFFIFFFFQKS